MIYELRRGFFNSTFKRLGPTLNPSMLEIAEEERQTRNYQ